MTAINGAAPSLDTWTDLSGFGQLRAMAQSDGGKAALPAVAKQFEAIFTQMMLKSMRQANASMGSSLGDSDAGDSYRDLFDQQLSLTLANGGNGIGIAKMLVRQLGGVQDGAVGTGGAAVALNAVASAARPGVSDLTNANVRALLQLGSAGGADGDGNDGILPSMAPAAGSEGLPNDDTFGQFVRGAASVAGTAARLLPGAGPVGFVQALAPHAAAAARKLGVSVRVLLAQAALETGWGKHLPSRSDGSSSFNMFGIKAGGSWDGAKVNVPTLEYEDGVAVRRNDQFRAYGSPAASFADYARLISDSPRYAQALGQGENVAGFAKALVRGGYATDPAYAEKITAIANSPQMRAALATLKNVGATPTSSE